MKIKTYLSERGEVPDEFIAKVKEIVGEENISQEERDLISYSLDYWLYGIFLSQKGELPALPSVIISPSNTGEVQWVMRLANEFKVQITPFGGGSGVLGGSIPTKGSAILNIQRMNKFISLDEYSLVTECEAGIIGANLEKELNHRGYSAGNIPQSVYCSTLGGWLSTRAAGQFSTKYGKIEDMALGMQVVLPSGELLTIKPVPRRSVGPSLKDLFMGAEGTLGIITKATISVHPLPETTVKQSFGFDSIDTALEVTRKILRGDAKPAVIRIFDETETERSFKGIWQLKDKVAIIFISEGDTDFVEMERRVIQKIAREHNGVNSGERPVDIWLERRFKVGTGSLLQRGGVVDTIEVVSLFRDAANLYVDMISSMKRVEGAASVSGHFSHFYKEGACLYVTFGGLPKDPLRFLEDIWFAAMDATIRHNASISHHHGIGYWRKNFMQQEMGETGVAILNKIKSALDPNRILNPGKVTDDGR